MIQGLVVRNFSQIYSRHTAQKSLQDYLEQSGVVGISDVDTRSIVTHIRKVGAMNAIISSETLDKDVLFEKMKALPNMNGLELSSSVTTPQAYEIGNKDAKFRVAVLDLGIKKSIIKNFTERDCFCKVFPAKTTFEEMKTWNPTGYFISNGPGDPAAADYAIETVSKILKNNDPLFGICLGHQIIAHASGVGTFKMHNGHRGLNHPVKNLLSGHCEITSQNHGFAVKREDLAKNTNVIETHVNLNDQTVAGIRLKDKPAFSVQYHPESSPGPHDSRYLFDEFIALMKK
jgi:carbamoyl-phosphate synthase small subunit